MIHKIMSVIVMNARSFFLGGGRNTDKQDANVLSLYLEVLLFFSD